METTPLRLSRSRKLAETISKTHGNHADAPEQRPETSGNHWKTHGNHATASEQKLETIENHRKIEETTLLWIFKTKPWGYGAGPEP